MGTVTLDVIVDSRYLGRRYVTDTDTIVLPEMDDGGRVKTNVLSWIIKISLIKCYEIMERHVANHIISDPLSHTLDYN